VAIQRSRRMTLLGRSRREYRAELNAIGIVQAFSVLDSYLTTRGDVLLHRELPLPLAGNPLEAYVHAQVSRQFRGPVRGPLDYWTKALGVDIEKHAPWWREIQELRTLRNLIVHSLGSVRPHGDPLPEPIARRLKALGGDPATYVGRIPTTDQDFDDLTKWVDHVVTWLDKERP
jgi:hypothetical protein